MCHKYVCVVVFLLSEFNLGHTHQFLINLLLLTARTIAYYNVSSVSRKFVKFFQECSMFCGHHTNTLFVCCFLLALFIQFAIARATHVCMTSEYILLFAHLQLLHIRYVNRSHERTTHAYSVTFNFVASNFGVTALHYTLRIFANVGECVFLLTHINSYVLI